MVIRAFDYAYTCLILVFCSASVRLWIAWQHKKGKCFWKRMCYIVIYYSKSNDWIWAESCYISRWSTHDPKGATPCTQLYSTSPWLDWGCYSFPHISSDGSKSVSSTWHWKGWIAKVLLVGKLYSLYVYKYMMPTSKQDCFGFFDSGTVAKRKKSYM